MSHPPPIFKIRSLGKSIDKPQLRLSFFAQYLF
jgi:hypothetical protein